MPHIHFQTDQSIPPTAAASDHEMKSPPLHAMGLLRNQKMPILEGKQKFEKTDLQRTFPIMPLFLDDGLMSGITTSTYSYQGGGDEGNQQQMFDEDGRSLMQPTTASEGLSRRKNRQGKGLLCPCSGRHFEEGCREKFSFKILRVTSSQH